MLGSQQVSRSSNLNCPSLDNGLSSPGARGGDMKALLVGGVLGLLLVSSGATAESLVVAVQGLKSDEGQVRVSLYREPDTFRKEAKALAVQVVPAQTGDVEVHFESLTAGTYAVMVYHDEDANDALKLRFGMFPLEGYGLSKDPNVMGPPAFEDSAFTVSPGENARQVVPIHY